MGLKQFIRNKRPVGFGMTQKFELMKKGKGRQSSEKENK
jgi:hypothetical protein